MNRTAKRLLPKMAFIVLLGILLGFVSNVRLIKQFFGGEFQYGFLTEEESSAITFITLPEAEDFFSRQAALFIDSRGSQAFKAGRIFGAVNIPFESPNKGAILDALAIPRERRLVVYCDGSKCQSSQGLSRELSELGYLDIKVFFGGWVEWQDAGLPIESGDEK